MGISDYEKFQEQMFEEIAELKEKQKTRALGRGLNLLFTMGRKHGIDGYLEWGKGVSPGDIVDRIKQHLTPEENEQLLAAIKEDLSDS